MFYIIIFECEENVHIKFGTQLYLIMFTSKNNTKVAARNQRKHVGDNEMAKVNTLSENEPKVDF